MRSNSFNLYTEEGIKYDLTEEMKRDYTPGRKIDIQLFLKNKKDYIPVRICAIAKSDEDIQKSQRQIKNRIITESRRANYKLSGVISLLLSHHLAVHFLQNKYLKFIV